VSTREARRDELPEDIPADTRSFIARYLDSVPQLEALLLLRDNPSESWTTDAVAKRLYTAQADPELVLARLCSDGLLSCSDGVYRYDCDATLASAVERLAEAYRSHLIAITNLIHAKPRRIREFADAFKLKRDS
jgi:hypothetical protein